MRRRPAVQWRDKLLEANLFVHYNNQLIISRHQPYVLTNLYYKNLTYKILDYTRQNLYLHFIHISYTGLSYIAT